MYVVPVKVSESKIEGKGVFANADITKGAKIWIYTDGHDLTLTPKEHDELSAGEKDDLNKTGYLSPWTDLWVFPPENDPARFTNHSLHNNLSVVYDSEFSVEPYFIATKDIKAGSELTNNYHEFDRITQQTKPSWAK